MMCAMRAELLRRPPTANTSLITPSHLSIIQRSPSLPLKPQTVVSERGSYDVDEHLLSPQDVAARFGTAVDWASIPNSKGLDAKQVEALREKHGLNRLTPPKERSEIVKFLLQV